MNTFTNSTLSDNNHTPSNTKQTRPNSTPNTRRSAFKPGVICGYCQKEGHYKSECYQLVGYPVGHPLHGKVKPGTSGQSGQNRGNRAIGQRAVNLVTGQSGQDNNGAEASTSGSQGDDEVYAKMDSLQNQLNQIKMMLQNTHGQCDFKLLATGRYLFIASCVSIFKDA